MPDRHRFGHLQRGDIDDRHVVADPIGGVEQLLVGREIHVPDTLPDEQVFDYLKAVLIDHRDPVGGPERHKRKLAVAAEIDPDRLDRLAPYTGKLE